jgi:hypothetical protein
MLQTQRRFTAESAGGEVGNRVSVDSASERLAAALPDAAPDLPTRGVGLPVQVGRQSQQPASLYATCTTMISTLYSFPLFEFYLFPDGEEMYMMPDSPMIEPVVSS